MRVLLLEDDVAEALAIEAALGHRHDIRTVATATDATRQLRLGDWRPEVLVTDLGLPDAEGELVLELLREAAPDLPVIIGSSASVHLLARQLGMLAEETAGEDSGPGVPPEPITALAGTAGSTVFPLGRVMIEIDRVAARAADAAVSRAVDELMVRLGLDDHEGVRLAVRLARGWEAAKAKFLSALATGIASALLLALGAGIIAMLRSAPSK